MKKIFGSKKNQEPPPSIQDATDRISKRGDSVDEKIKKLDAELARYKDQIKKTSPSPAQEPIKARAMRLLKQRRMYLPNLPFSCFPIFLRLIIYLLPIVIVT
ncbi:hypothetical protein E2562_030666 [Oryza meyeriana var. granulata]|nr:hypothetical protein E2562_030666 [Oryza meyeriana var. granulata]